MINSCAVLDLFHVWKETWWHVLVIPVLWRLKVEVGRITCIQELIQPGQHSQILSQKKQKYWPWVQFPVLGENVYKSICVIYFLRNQSIFHV
jgi:hypothetical protein